MKLPGAENAIADIAKLRDYCLNSEHPNGKNKARVFASVLAIGPADAFTLRAAVLRAVGTGDAVPGERDGHGSRYIVDFEMTTAKGTAIVRSAWIIKTGESVPRLTSCYVR
jgi:hypothetical protein